MKTSYLRIIFLCGAFSFMLSSCDNEKKNQTKDTLEQREVADKKGAHNIVLDNEYAQVIQIKLESGEFISPPGGEGKVRAIYSLSNYTLD